MRQEDIFFSQLTVRETLLMAAKLQLPAELSDSEKELHVEALIQNLGLVINLFLFLFSFIFLSLLKLQIL